MLPCCPLPRLTRRRPLPRVLPPPDLAISPVAFSLAFLAQAYLLARPDRTKPAVADIATALLIFHDRTPPAISVRPLEWVDGDEIKRDGEVNAAFFSRRNSWGKTTAL